ncbi:MAG: molecular chaperone DnaK [bacterium]|nr:molecular chaperone DnaK [bacterium]
MGKIIGIDLGTTTSLMAFMDRDKPAIIPNNLGERITQSVVCFTKSGEILVGKKAKKAAIMNVGRTVFSIKRHMGTDYRVKIDNKDYTPQEISSMLLQKLKHDAEEYFGEEVNQAVVTVPAYFTDKQRTATKDAGEIAGFNVRRIIDEPTAAALAYGLDKEEDQRLLVYDFGGGTFDVSIIEVISGVFQVLAIQGNTHLGGDDLDNRIVHYLVEEFKKNEGINLAEDETAMFRLKEVAEEAKIELSEVLETEIILDAIATSPKGPLTLTTTLTRSKLEQLIYDLVERTVDPTKQAIEDAGLTTTDIDRVILVGGTTRIPAVHRLVKEIVKKEPHKDIIPEEVVALGAAVQSLVLAPLEGELEDTLAARYGKEAPIIVHLTPFSLGVGLINDQFGVLIERNSTYPTEAKDVFTTTRDFQEAISFPLYEGESQIASENTFLDMLRIDGITPAPRGVPRIEVTFRLNPDRILEARAIDLATSKEKQITVKATDSRLTEKEKQRMIQEAKSRVAKILKQQVKETVQQDAESLIFKAEKVVAESDDFIVEDIELAIKALKGAMDGKDTSKIESKMEALNALLNRLSEAAR